MQTVEIGKGPVRANVSLLNADGTPYTTGKPVGRKPVPIGRAVPSDSPVVPPPQVPAPTAGGTKVLFEVGDHSVTSTFNEVSTSVGTTHLVLDVTDRPDAFLPFFTHLKAHRPGGEVISALPSGGRTAFSLAVDRHPPVAIAVGGRRIYLVPITDSVDVPPSEHHLFAAQAAATPAYEDMTRDDQDRGDRAEHPAGPDVPTPSLNPDFVLPGDEDDDTGVELQLPGDEDRPRSVSSVLA